MSGTYAFGGMLLVTNSANVYKQFYRATYRGAGHLSVQINVDNILKNKRLMFDM